MSNSALDPFYQNGLAILRNAKAPDGGLVGYMLSQVNLSLLPPPGNNISASPFPIPIDSLVKTQVQSTLFHHGFLWAIFFGVVWTLFLLISGVCLCVLHFHRKRTSKTVVTYKLVAKRIQQRRQRMDSNRVCLGAQLVVGVLAMLSLLALFCLAVKSLADTRQALVEPSTGSQYSVLPRTALALRQVHGYLRDFAANAANASAPVIDEIIAETENMQNKSSYKFNAALQEKIGGARSMQLGEVMTNFLLTMTDNSEPLSGPLNDQMFQETRLLRSTLASWKRSLRHWHHPISSSSSSNFSQQTSQFLKWSLATSPLDLKFNFAITFLFFMKNEGRTREKIVEDANYGKVKMRLKMLEMKEKMNAELDVPQLLRGAIEETWVKLDVKMRPVVARLERILAELDTQAQPRLQKISGLLLAVAIIGLLVVVASLATVFLVFYRYHFLATALRRAPEPLWADPARNPLKVWTYSLLVALCVPLLFCMVLFLSTGYLETDMCRYMRATDVESEVALHQEPLLDSRIKAFLAENWDLITVLAKDPNDPAAPPLPRPGKFLGGLVQGCRINAGILEALDCIRSMDPRSLSKPELTNKIIAVGRRLMLQAMHDTDPMEMIAPGTMENLQKAGSLEKFVNVNMSELVKTVEGYRHLFVGTVGLSTPEAIDQLTNFLTHLPNENNASLADVRSQTNEMLQVLVRIHNIQEKTLVHLRAIRDLPPLLETVKELQMLLPRVVATLGNKTELVNIADALFHELVVVPTPNNSVQIMQRFAPRLMANLGRCQPLYVAYREMSLAACGSVLEPLSGLWLFLGCMCLLCTTFLVFLLSLLSKTPPNSSGNGEISGVVETALTPSPSLALNNLPNNNNNNDIPSTEAATLLVRKGSDTEDYDLVEMKVKAKNKQLSDMGDSAIAV